MQLWDAKTVWKRLWGMKNHLGALVEPTRPDETSQANALAAATRKRSVSQECELLISDPAVDGEDLRWSAQLLRPSKSPAEIWFKLPKQHQHAVTKRADP